MLVADKVSSNQITVSASELAIGSLTSMPLKENSHRDPTCPEDQDIVTCFDLHRSVQSVVRRDSRTSTSVASGSVIIQVQRNGESIS